MTLTIEQRALLLLLCRREADEREGQFYLLSRTYGEAHPDTERARLEWDRAKGLLDVAEADVDYWRAPQKREEDWR